MNNRHRYSGLALFLLTMVFFVSCTSNRQSRSHTRAYQAISALGDTLYSPAMNDSLREALRAKKDSARSAYDAHPDSAEAIIWYGRRTAYLGHYREAIAIFTEGIEKHPEDARFYRHRGHRYITTRQFDNAIADLERAAELIRGTPDRIEPDGLPNARNQPRSTLHTNIWYHLGLAHYLRGQFEEAAARFRTCLEAAPNDDMRVAASYWLYMSLRRAGMDLQAGTVLEPIREQMDIIENQTYHKLLQVFKGNFEEKVLLDDIESSLDNATVGYGLGNWHYINGRPERAEQLFRDVYAGSSWAAFGYIAAETDLARLFGSE